MIKVWQFLKLLLFHHWHFHAYFSYWLYLFATFNPMWACCWSSLLFFLFFFSLFLLQPDSSISFVPHLLLLHLQFLLLILLHFFPFSSCFSFYYPPPPPLACHGRSCLRPKENFMLCYIFYLYTYMYRHMHNSCNNHLFKLTGRLYICEFYLIVITS